MEREHYQRVKAHMVTLIALAPDARLALLEELAATDTALARELRELLGAATPTRQQVHAEHPEQWEMSLLQPLLPPEIVLKRVLGRGGMGVVYLAERKGEGFAQQVAIKMLGSGILGTPGAFERFLSERSILAALQHPNIARFIDGGATRDGRPYLVLEYVEGATLNEWCRQRDAPLAARIRLFIKICGAVQRAHQQLVVHRDLKPANILVDQSGEPKLLDFGIAKLEAEPGAATLTALGERAMTMHYASPEQIRGEPIGTASDVYSLGVVLCELLCGALPYRNSATTDLDIARAICDDPPLAPSAALTASRQAAEPIGKVDTKALKRQLSGDLDQIVLKALRKEPQERYGSPAALADDLERLLAGLPVLARRGSRTYFARKFIARNRLAVAAAAVLLVLTVAFALDRQTQLTATRNQRDRAEQSLNLLREVLSSADPALSGGKELTAKEILEAGAAKLESDPEIDPALRFELLLTVASIEENLDLHDSADQRLESAGRIEGIDDEARDQLDFQRLTLRNSQGKYAESEAISARLLARVDAGIDGLSELDRVKLLVARANTLHVLGRGTEAYALSARALPLIPATPEGERLRVSVYSQLGQILQNLGRMDEAESYLAQTLKLDAKLGLDPLRVSRDENNLAGLLAVRGRFRESLALHKQAIPRLVATLGKDAPEYALRMNNLGMTEYGAGHLADAIAHVGDAAALAQARYGDENQVVLSVRSNYALVLTAAGEFERADVLVNAALVGLQKLFPGGSLAVIRAERTAGIVAFERAQLDLARAHFQACVDGIAAARLEANPILARCRSGLAEIALAQDRLDDAHTLIEESVAQQTLSLDPRHPDNAVAALAKADWQIRSGSAGAATTLQAIHAEALNEPWQLVYRDMLIAAAKGDCESYRTQRATLLGRYPAEHPRWRGLCP